MALLLRLLVSGVLEPEIFVLVVLAQGLILVREMFESEILMFLSQVPEMLVLMQVVLVLRVLASEMILLGIIASGMMMPSSAWEYTRNHLESWN